MANTSSLTDTRSDMRTSNMADLKQKSVRSRKWLAAVGGIDECVLCGAYGTQVAHSNFGKGMGLKVPDHLTAALCPDCHFEIDNGKTMTREERRAAMDRAIVRTFDRLVRAGRVGLQ